MSARERRKTASGKAKTAVRESRARPFVFWRSAPAAHFDTIDGGRFLFRFALPAIALIVLLSVLPERFFDPMNRITAAMVGELLHLTGRPVVVDGSSIRIQAFTARVIGECLALQPMALYAAFILAFPTPRRAKGLALAGGLALLQALNLLRIALVTLLGAHSPGLFDLAHIHLGQVAMIAAVLGLALFWCRRRHPDREGAPLLRTAFAARFLVYASLLFLAWVPLNRPYMGLLDGVIQRLFALAGFTLILPRDHVLYFQTFGLVTFAGLVLAMPGHPPLRKFRFLAWGCILLTVFQLSFRLCNVWLSAFQIGWLAPVAQATYHLCVYALPVIAAAVLLTRGATRG